MVKLWKLKKEKLRLLTILLVSNIVKNLNVSRYSDFDPTIENVKDPTFKTIHKYKKHPRILVIRTKSKWPIEIE